MGFSKAALPFGEETMLERVVRLVGEVAAPVVVVAARDETVEFRVDGVQLCRDRVADRGPLEGLAVGLSAVRASAPRAFVCGCDAPLLQAAFAQRLMGLATGHDAAIPLVDGMTCPLPGVYSVGVLDEIDRLLGQGTASLRDLLARIDTRFVPDTELANADPTLQSLQNVNRPEEYFAALAAVGLDAPPEVRERLDPD